MESPPGTTSTAPKPGWSTWSNGQRLIIVATGLGFISLFLPWIDIGIATRSGWDELAFFGILLFAYPVYAALTGKKTNKWVPLGLAIGAMAFGVWFYSDHTQTVWSGDERCDDPEFREWANGDGRSQVYEPCEKETLDFNGSGVVAYLTASGGFLVGSTLDLRRKGPAVSGPKQPPL